MSLHTRFAIAARASSERLRESVRIYVMCPFSYKRWATDIVCDTE